jgi:hypothetical protein
VSETSGESFFAKHRRRIGGVVLLILVALLLTHGSQVLPSTLHLSLPLADAAHVTAVDVSLTDRAGSEAYHLRQRYDGDAPDTLSVEAEVLAGRYEVSLRVHRGEASSELIGDVEAPADGEVRVHLRAP